jgi:L-ascorbate metabolism protein UlaG (beta-lactamase superfamily)
MQDNNLLIEHIGHSTIRIKSSEGKVIYIDPWSNCLDGEPRDGDLIFVTHDDSDHYDPDAISVVAKQGATVATYEAITTDELEMVVTELPYNSTVVVAGIDVQTVPGYNDPTGEHVDENNNPYHADGEVIGLQIVIDDTSIFYPSDTDVLPHHKQINAEVLLPPIGGTYTMNRHEAAELARDIKPELIIPVHYDTFEAIETDVHAFVDEVSNDEISVKLD